MKEMNDIPNEVLTLLESKAFNELTKEEQSLVLSYVSEKDYKDYQSVIHDFKAIDSALEFDDSLPDLETTAAAKETRSKSNPIYRLAAGFVILILGGLTIWDLSNKPLDIDENVVEMQEKTQSIDPRLVEMRMEIVKQSIETEEIQIGTSLANEDFPEDIALEFDALMMGGGTTRDNF